MKICKYCNIKQTRKNFLYAKCKSCKALVRKAHDKKNRAKLNKQRREYVKNNKELVASWKRADYLKHKPKRLATMKNWVKRNTLLRNKISKKYRKANPEKVNFLTAKRRAAKLQRIPKWLTKSDWIEIRWAYTEARRLTKLTGIQHEVDHIIPLQGKKVSGLHCPQNLQILTSQANKEKSDSFTPGPFKR